jgi:hypothetical protein
MVRLLSADDVYPYQRVAERPALGDWPPAPLALKSCVTMLDSGGMSESEDKPPTLASLRARRGKLRAAKRPSPPWPDPDSLNQAGLFSDVSEIAPVLDRPPAEAPLAREGSPFAPNKPQRNPP